MCLERLMKLYEINFLLSILNRNGKDMQTRDIEVFNDSGKHLLFNGSAALQYKIKSMINIPSK